jgi:hypothetical protein
VARHVLALTHLAFWGEASTGRLPSALRGGLAPLAAPLLPVLIGRRRFVAGGSLPADPLISIHHLTSVPGRGLTAVRPDGYIGSAARPPMPAS